MRKLSKSLLAKDSLIQSRTDLLLQRFHPITPKQIRAFEQSLIGSVVLPTDPNYNNDRQVWNPAFQDYPEIIVYCETIQDVRASLAFARKHNLWVVSRSGRHSTAGYSVNNAMVLDTSKLDYVTVDPDVPMAYVGPGTPFRKLNSVLNSYHLHVPGGACQDVCVAGFMMGGGYGFTSRMFGMACDNVLGVTVMLWDGSIVIADADTNPDLFWAIRGGTGNNFGVLLEVRYKLQKLYKVWGFHIKWPLKKAAKALEYLQAHYMKDGLSDKFGAYIFIAYQGKEKVLLVSGMYHGPKKEGMKLIQPLLDKPIGGHLENDKSGTYQQINSWLYDEKYDIPVVPDQAREDKQGGYIERQLSQSEWQMVVDYLDSTPNEYGAVAIEPYGGAINKVPVGKKGNAFIHRNVSLNFYVDVFWLSQEEKETVVPWLDGFMNLMTEQGFFIDRCYQNYPRRSQLNYRWLYWGDNFNSLLFVKNKFDPHNFFHYQQSISPVPKDAPRDIIRDRSKSFFSDKTITYQFYSKP
ncbi:MULTISPECIES: FAD-binding oxidoreductase [unclassified Ruegeria]|uniref:FAD-dependent oxidoreductase n=1 Tax=unclassified Ruegeria TaxID=2625375 RepID=UPI0014886C93|nr:MULTISPECIES: FAD-binding oxidoreductase [unclassified Ruegeria]